MFHTYELVKTLKAEIANGQSWGDIVKKYYPNEDPDKLRPLLWKMVKKNYDPKNNRLRERLGLVTMKRVEACSECNQIHFTRCPKSDDTKLPSVKKVPSPALIRTRERRARLDARAREWGYAGWSAYETVMLDWSVP
jgi:hypothetical protein